MTDQSPAPVLHWFLPTGGDDRRLGSDSHGVAIGDGLGRNATGSGRSGPLRPASLAYLTQLAQAVENLGFRSVLTPTGAHCLDAWIATSALVATTSRLRFLVALRPGLVAPVLTAQMAATFQALSGGRLALNVVAGGSPVEQRGYGDPAGHDERYARAAEFLDVFRAAAPGRPFTHHGRYYHVDDGLPRDAVDPYPPVYLGGSSPAALAVAAEHADVFLSWGEPVAALAEKIDRVRELAAAAGRTVRFGVRLHVVTRDTTEQAWADAERLIADVDDDTVARRQQSLRQLDSVGQQRMLALHGGDRERLLLAPHLWAGIGLVRGGAGTALVGSHAEVAGAVEEYRAIGVDEFVLSGYPHLEEAYAVAEGVLPLLTAGRPTLVQ